MAQPLWWVFIELYVRYIGIIDGVKRVCVCNNYFNNTAGICDKYTPILSLDASEGMGLLKIKDCDPLDYVCTVNESSKLTEINLKAEYADVFQGLGRLKDRYSNQIDDSIRPVVHAPRRVPVPMRNKVHEKRTACQRRSHHACDG